ncbi:hypothetical protein P1O39_10240 [Staphylococcus epidermidis]|uniref:hypothetical protein n=1 Tax=Staphylococcus TaxID=1279 RepID=UPI00073B0411|nr:MULTISPECIES: hypothetical protein [Staphylococcus]RRJ55774.1 hypothetical protein EIM20_28905 [Pseudomonas aeruginosa]KAB2268555.1 hypothetical protein F9B68_08420 [Staphylococcus epidermidis]KTF23666.1 hypothetical protein ATO65_09395 [Staphylococcus epidermidis]KTF27098.1 hypothetical protein ATO05_10125 [Staphylococcus epidermidis]MBE7347450.1 hypothetical protein [Staphylococcus epidermidis]
MILLSKVNDKKSAIAGLRDSIFNLNYTMDQFIVNNEWKNSLSLVYYLSDLRQSLKECYNYDCESDLRVKAIKNILIDIIEDRHLHSRANENEILSIEVIKKLQPIFSKIYSNWFDTTELKAILTKNNIYVD